MLPDTSFKCGTRFKFASVTETGAFFSDPYGVSEEFARESPPGWSMKPAVQTVQHEGFVETRSAATHRSWFYYDGTNEIITVEHETGLEILIPIGQSVASVAIVAFSVWAWTRWRKLKVSGTKPTLIIETIDRLTDGTEEHVRRVTIHSATEEDIETALGSE